MARKIPEINAASMADIAFMLLIFFLVTTTMDTDTGLYRLLPPPLQDETPPPEIKERNVLVVLINSKNQLLVGGQLTDVSELKEKAKEFILNPMDDLNLPEKKIEEIEHFGKIEVTKGIISLRNDRGTEYQMYLKVTNELVAAYNELREGLAKRKFGKPYKDLPKDQKNAIRKVYKQAISEAEPKNVGGSKNG